MSAAYDFDAAGQRERSVVASGSLTTTTTWTYEGLTLLSLGASRSDGATWSVTYLSDASGRAYAGLHSAEGFLSKDREGCGEEPGLAWVSERVV